MPPRALLCLVCFAACCSASRPQDLQIHGNEPCALFNDADPFWEQYGRDPGFVPAPGDFLRLRDNAVLLKDWRFMKTAWVLRSQVRCGRRRVTLLLRAGS